MLVLNSSLQRSISLSQSLILYDTFGSCLEIAITRRNIDLALVELGRSIYGEARRENIACKNYFVKKRPESSTQLLCYGVYKEGAIQKLVQMQFNENWN